VEHLIQLFTTQGAVILDPFMGSGTTAVAAVISNRKYIGFDINQEYIDISNKRVLSVLKE